MKKYLICTLFIFSNLFGSLSQAHPNGPHQGRYESHRQNHHHGRWIAPLAAAALVGGAVYATRPVYANPPVVLSQPVYMEPLRVAYFCQPYQQYYPTVGSCPLPWQVVPY
ncbi:MAG: hypothetical protein EXR35_11020 [Limnohabitans sp.]|nr:hypothetical protein [Limnohabitans sp.]